MVRVNWLQYRMIKEDGYGRYGMRQAQALIRAGVDLYPDLVESLDMPGWALRARGVDFSRLTISTMPPHDARKLPGRQWLSTMYEATRLRKGWIDHVHTKGIERVVVPAPWLVEVFESHGCQVPIHIVPGGIEPSEFPVMRRNRTLRPYTFLALGDRGSRKGWDVAWQAFYKAFGDKPTDVRLLIKRRGVDEWQGRVRFDMTSADHEGITFWSEDVDNMADVYAQADCFVFPTRAEGYGLPPREGAATGMPVICTAWSGTEVDIEQWAIPIRNFRLVNAMVEAEPYPSGKPAQWAQPDVDEVAAHMRWCFDHQDEADQLGLKAAAWLRANQTWDHSAACLLALIKGDTDGAHQ